VPKSSGDYIQDIRRRVRDTTASNNTWTRQEILDAVNDGLKEARGAFWARGVYDSLQVAPNGNWYTLPPWITRVTRVERDISEGVSTIVDSGAVRREILYDWGHHPEQQTNRLRIGGNFPTSKLSIYYEADLPIFPFEATLTTGVTATARIIPFIASNDNVIADWKVPGYFKIGREIIYYEAITITSFTGVTRGIFGTGIQTATSPFGLKQDSETLIQPVFVQDFSHADDFIVKKAFHSLFSQRLISDDVEGSRTIGALAAEWGRAAQEAKDRDRMRRNGGTIRMKRVPRG